MESRSKSNGLETFFQHWGFLIPVVVAIITAKAPDFPYEPERRDLDAARLVGVYPHNAWRRYGCPRQDACVTKRIIPYLRARVGASAAAQVLCLGLAGVASGSRFRAVLAAQAALNTHAYLACE
jgi:hypothetical protein